MGDSPSISERLAAFAHGVTAQNLPVGIEETVHRRLLDTAGVAIGALTLPTSSAVTDLVIDRGGRPQSTALGIDVRVPVADAAFVNGVLAHSLDFDDTHLPSVLHPSASVIPAALAVAEAKQATASELVVAIAIGLEVCVRLGMAGYDETRRASVYFDRGQHATSICGTVGAAAACARLLGLEAAEIVDALGIAASMASGILEGNRTGGTVKRIHCGWAAQAGVTAAMLARRGITGPPTAFEGRFGFLYAFLGDQAHAESVTDGLGLSWESANIFVKPYPANHFTHAVVDAGIALRTEEGLVPDDVASAVVGVAGAAVRTIGEPLDQKQTPQTGYQAQFSGPYALSVGLFGGGGLGAARSDYSDEIVTRNDRRAFMARVDVRPDPVCDAIFPEQFPAIVRVLTTSGDRLEKCVLETRGGPARPLSDGELTAKFRAAAGEALSRKGVDAAAEAVASMRGEASVYEAMGALGAATGHRLESYSQAR